MRRESTLHLFGSVQLLALLADRLKQFTLVGMLRLLVPASSFELLKLTLFSQVPILIFTPLIGSFIDRWNKPAAIVGACVIRSVLVMCVPLFYDRTHTIYAFYIDAFITSIFDLVFAPARSALLPEVVHAQQSLGIIGTLLGFVGGGWIFDYFSWHSSFYATAVVYAGAAILMLPLVVSHRPVSTVTPLPRDPRHGIAVLARSVRDALDLLRQSRELRASLSTQAGLFAVGGVMSVIGISRVHEVVQSG